MSFYSNLAATAARLITSKGQSMTLSRETGGTFDPATGQNSPATAVTYSFNGVEVPATRADDAYFEPGTLANGKARVIVAEALDVEPIPGDSVTYGGETVEVLGATRVAPAGVAVIYKIRGVV